MPLLDRWFCARVGITPDGSDQQRSVLPDVAVWSSSRGAALSRILCALFAACVRLTSLCRPGSGSYRNVLPNLSTDCASSSGGSAVALGIASERSFAGTPTLAPYRLMDSGNSNPGSDGDPDAGTGAASGVIQVAVDLAEPANAPAPACCLLAGGIPDAERSRAALATQDCPNLVELLLILVCVLVHGRDSQGEPDMKIISIPTNLVRVATLLVVLAALCTTAVPLSAGEGLQPATQRKPAPSFSLTDDKDAKVALADFKGKVVLVNFWATWCHGCKQEIPWYMAFADKYRGRGFVVIGVSMDEDGWKAVRPFLQEKKLNYTVVIGSDALANQYGLDSMPLSVLIDRDGKIAASHSGVVEKDNWEQGIQQLLQEHPKE